MVKNLYYKNDYAKIVANLRQLGRNQIESRLKLIQEGSYIPNDILTITLKSYGNYYYYFFNFNYVLNLFLIINRERSI